MSVGLVFGTFDLFDTVGTDYSVETLAEGTDWGNPEPIEVAIRSLLQDGSIVVTQGHDNRTLTVRVIITAPDAEALAQGESALFAEVGKQNTLTYTPTDGFGAVTVFDVVTSSLLHTMDDLAEVRGERVYTLRMVCRPFGRGETPQIITPTPTTIGTARQQSYTFDVAGSARTEASLHVVGSSGLGFTLIHTRPGGGGFIPLRQHRTGGGSVTTASTWVSGGYDNNITTPFVASVPKEDVPDGTYIVLALVRKETGTGAVTLASIMSTQLAGYDLATPDSRSLSASLTTTYSLIQFGTKFQVPSGVVAGDTAVNVVVSIGASVATRLDEAWLVEVGTGALTWLDSAPTSVGMPNVNHFWIETPTADRPERRILKGAFADQVLAFGANPVRWGQHVLEPGTNGAFVVTTTNTDTALDLTVENRFHTHATAP